MEVFRPFVDHLVFGLRRTGEIDSENDRLSASVRQTLANIGNVSCSVNGQIQAIGNACEIMAAGLVSAIEGKTPALFAVPEWPPQRA